MKPVLEQKVKRLYIKKELQEGTAAVEAEESRLRKVATKSQQINKAREYYAASKIQAIVKGFLDRILCKRKRKYLKTVQLIQRIFLGKLGRMRWKREYWRSLSVVKSDTSLAEIMGRSKILREHIVTGKRGYKWIEYFDPLTESFWYFNTLTKLNTWQVPMVFQKDLVCYWDGYQSYGGQPHIKPCRCVFDTMDEFRNHVRLAHCWYCVACHQKNSGLNFPKCFLCENTFNEDGIDGEKVLRNSMYKVRRQVESFLDKDVTAKDSGLFKLKERLMALAQERQVAMDAMQQLQYDLEFNAKNPDGSSSKANQVKLAIEQAQERYIAHAHNTVAANVALERSVVAGLSNSLFTHQKLADGGADLPAPPSPTASSTRKGIHTGIQNKPTSTGFDRLNVHSLDEEEEVEEELAQPIPTLPSSIKNRVWEDKFQSMGGIEGEKDRFRNPNTKGIFNDQDFDMYMRIHDEDFAANLALNLYANDSDDESSVSSVQSVESIGHKGPSTVRFAGGVAGNSSAVGMKSKKEPKLRMQVCEKYLVGQCTLTTCPLAHPGIRDAARPKKKTLRDPKDGSKTVTHYVSVCPQCTPLQNLCAKGRECRDYHVYIRPSTQDIILAVYPVQTGRRSKEYGTAKLVGTVVRGEFDGYGVMTWRDGSTYMGDWANSKRNGWGLFRHPDGSEYVGCFKDGERHGWGIQINANGDEYIGQWKSGNMEGVGVLQCRNGDVYEGSFVNNQYDGIGCFKRAKGDIYMGYCKLGQAHGLGILVLSTGEKYKGYFDHNARHGKGACAYPNGSRYFGMWYRGVHQGNGIYLSPEGEKYIGTWAGGKKHGKGRYIFLNGDFYDGEFHKNKAHGVGVYYHSNGNVFTGQWANDKRTGRGTYVFANGSKYTGHWWENDIHTKGRFDYACGSYYRGEFFRNKKDGKGIFTWPTGNVYKGEFKDDKMCGKGEMTYSTGHRYVGMWANNKKNGYGVFYYHNGAVYEGNFVDDIRQGFGKLTFMAGSAVEEGYEGEWDQDEWHGHGIYRYRKEEGTVYEGDWVRGVREGHGKITFKDGSYYRGDMQKNQMWGHGIFVGSDNTQYDGEWRANMRQGIGTALYEDGSIYHGEFWGNMKQGKGRLQRTDGTVYTGTWDSNIIVGTGKVTIAVGDKNKRDGLPKEITLKVFGY